MKITSILENIERNLDYFERLSTLKDKPYNEYTHEDWTYKLTSNGTNIKFYPGTPPYDLQLLAVNNHPMSLIELITKHIQLTNELIHIGLTHRMWKITASVDPSIREQYLEYTHHIFKDNTLLVNKWLRYFDSQILNT
jgi:hypothetical protein